MTPDDLSAMRAMLERLADAGVGGCAPKPMNDSAAAWAASILVG